jgi:cystathionine beta-lyase/cystathionine gamma-synthase
LKRLRVFTRAKSLGGVEFPAQHPAIMTHVSIPAVAAAVRRGNSVRREMERSSSYASSLARPTVIQDLP